MSRQRATAVALGAVLGGLAGHAAATGLAQQWAEAQPAGWRRVVEPQPYMNPATYGPIGVDGSRWVVGHYEAMVAPAAASVVEVTVVLPEDGELTVFPATGTGLEGAGFALRPGTWPIGVRVSPDRGPEETPCVGGAPALPANTPVTVRVTRADKSISATVDGQSITCPGAPVTGPAALQAGLRRVALERVEVDGDALPAPLSGGARVGGVVLGAAAGAALVALEALTGIGWVAAALGWLPLALAALLAGRELGALHEVLRMPALPLRQVPLLLGLGLSLAVKAALHAGRLARRGRAGWAGGVLLGVAVGAAPALGVGAPAAAILGFAAAGGVAAALAGVQANATRIKAYNLVSLGLFLALLGLGEAAVRQTSVGDFWNGEDRARGAGTAATLAQEFDQLVAAAPSTYPSGGYPVAAPPKRAPVRVVCLGGSSTGGAFQNADIGEFYPARLAERLGPRVEVVNQGTGGWNTLHIALFAEQSLARLQPDVVTVYAGVNDQAESPVPYRDLYAAWEAGRLGAPGTAWLGSVRLFQGLRYLARGARGSVIAVPPADTATNLSRVVAAARAVGANTLLMSEGVQPRPEAFAPYWSAMETVAAGPDDVAFLHTADQLRGLGARGFLDQNHLTDLGHRKLAERIEAALRGRGWLRPAGATVTP